MKPKDVNPAKFKVEEVLYDYEGFSVVTGMWKEHPSDKAELRVGMRWNGDDEEKGYPNQGGNPMWFIVSDYIAKDIIESVKDKEGANKEKIEKELKRL